MSSDFVFGRVPDSKDAFRLDLPAGLATKADLLAAYAKGGRFPSSFGANWDALADCLRDLSWIPQKRVVVAHADAPLAGEDTQLEIYLAVLARAVADWKASAQHELIVVFPETARRRVEKMR